MVFIQGYTVSLPVLQRFCSESSVTFIDTRDVISMNRVDSDMDCQGEEIFIAISFPKIKCEKYELSYICVCPLLDTLCQYPEMLIVIHHLHIYANQSTYSVQLQYTEISSCNWNV